MPPNEKPRTSHVVNFNASTKAWACVDIPAMVVGTEPLDRPRPAFSNKIASRSIASGSVTAGSQLSSVPVKCCRHSNGGFDPEPKRRYAYRSFPAWINLVGVVTMLGPFLDDMELTPKQDLKLQFRGEYSLEFLTEHEPAESDVAVTGVEVVSIHGTQRVRKTRAFVIFGGRPTHLLEISAAICCGWSALPGRARAAKHREPLPQCV